LLSAAGIFFGTLKAFWSKHKPGAARFGAITALIFAGQMMNFPIKDGTSGHLLGGVLAVALLGVPYGMLSIALVVAIQCIVFSDGGFTVLGANILNMAVIGAGLGGLVHLYFKSKFPERSGRYFLGLGLAAWFSVMMAALACSVELALSGTIAFDKVSGAMLGTHALIGMGEGLITVAACFALSAEPVSANPRRSAAVPLAASCIIAAMLSPFASGFPDGLEWVAEKYRFLHEAAPTFVSPLPDYTVPAVGNEMITTAAAGLIGVVVTFLIAWAAAKLLQRTGQPETV
ncbi:MAG: energy-coupling factor ABC transporter permease, partial [Candidatus Omnitrophota bacterium]|jgi:cobalt/nickel transport system permease protein